MTTKNWENSTMMQAVRCQPVTSIPIWLMRQAGRYMQEYQRVRERVTFPELCKRPELAAEVMLTAVNRLGVDAAILFSDILLILEPMGFQLEFPPDGGPKVSNPIQQPEDVDRVHELSAIEPMQFMMDAVRYTREGLDDTKPLIGFAGAPFTLAAYAVEGGGSKNFHQVKAFMHLYPTKWHDLMRRLAVSVARCLNGQISAGVQIVQIFDSWGGCVSEEDYKKYVLPYSKMLIDLIMPGTPIVHFVPGNPMLLPHVRDAGGHVIGIDWRIGVDKAWDMVGLDRAIQGNLDPAILMTDRETIRRHAQHIIRLTDRQPGFVFNLGSGITPQTPVDNVIALVDIVHELGQMR
jgi:uroporphyrinogen decarboxylase